LVQRALAHESRVVRGEDLLEQRQQLLVADRPGGLYGDGARDRGIDQIVDAKNVAEHRARKLPDVHGIEAQIDVARSRVAGISRAGSADEPARTALDDFLARVNRACYTGFRARLPYGGRSFLERGGRCGRRYVRGAVGCAGDEGGRRNAAGDAAARVSEERSNVDHKRGFRFFG
jgi:hypothetical protein